MNTCVPVVFYVPRLFADLRILYKNPVPRDILALPCESVYLINMRPIDHFFSQIDSASRLFRGGELDFRVAGGQEARDRLMSGFTGLTAPILGKPAASDLCMYCLDSLEGKKPESLQKLGYMAAFFLGEFDDAVMRLDADDWNEIRETLEDVSDEINLDTLTELMADLLERKVLGNT